MSSALKAKAEYHKNGLQSIVRNSNELKKKILMREINIKKLVVVLKIQKSMTMEKLFSQSIEDLKNIYKFSEEELQILETVDKAADEIALSELKCYLERKVNKEGRNVAKKYGLFSIPIKKEYGGLGANHLVSALAEERLGQMSLGFAITFNVQVFLGGLSIQRWGTEEQKERYLKPAAKGDIMLAYALTEPEYGSEPTALKTSYEEVGGRYIVNGSKYLITNGSIAKATIVFAYPRGKQEGMTAFIVDTDSEGFNVAMELETKIGLFSSDTALLEFKDVEVPKENVLGPLSKGLHIAYSGLLNGRMAAAASSVGSIEDCLNASVARAKERVQHKKLIGMHQLIQRHIAEIAQNLEMARWPTYFAALRKIEYDKNPDDRELRLEMDKRTALAKKIATRLAFESADRAVQIFGGFGYSLLSAPGRHYCDTRATRIYEGTDEIMELKIASLVLGKEFEAYS